ncbi:hypothetical protein QOZ80_1BG0052220 [Eleusine coracana subsp. coracana]|nr:hypothetical protein QOZ80_1BG0052220 [Eleusine coracana subsp. coracana]
MRAITGSIVSSEHCPLLEAHHMLRRMCRSADTYLSSSDCLTYVYTLDEAIREQIKFVRRLGRQHGAAGHDARGYEGPVEGEGERWGGENNRDMVVHLHGSVEGAKVAVAADEKKSKKRKKVEDTHEDKAAGVPSHAPASPEILFEQRRKKEKHPSRELFSVVKQEPDLVVEEDVGTERKKKKKEKHSDTQLAIVVKQEPGLVVEEELGSEKKSTKKKEMARVKLEEQMVEVKGQIVSNGVAEQGGVADGEKRRKKKKHSEEEGNSKGVKQEEKLVADCDLDSEKKKKKKKRGRGDNDDNIQEQGDHKKKKQRKESRE